MPIQDARREIIRTNDHDGKPIVLVSLSNHSEPAKLYAQDFDRLIAEGVSPNWTLLSSGNGKRYVRGRYYGRNDQLPTIARLILRAGKGKAVSLMDGNPLNLRRDNLRLVSGKGADTAALRQPPKADLDRPFWSFLHIRMGR